MARYVDGFVIAVAKVGAYRNNSGLQKDMPFEMKRMAFGGFKTLVYW